MMKLLLLSAVLAASAAAPAAASGDDNRLGPEVDRLCFSSSIDRWSAVEGQDGAILLDRGANNWYFVEITDGCSEKLIRRANAVIIEGKPGSACLAANDSISLVDYGGLKTNCRIKRIYEWNVKGAPPDVGAAPKAPDEGA